jgi:hypothetical protein
LVSFLRAALLTSLVACALPAFAQFETRAAVPVFPYDDPNSPAVGDFNKDGSLDFAVTSVFGDSVAVVLGNGDGTFKPPVLYTAGETPTAVVAADLNHNGKLDLVVGNYGSGNLSVLLGNGDGTFQNAVNYDVPAGGNVGWVGVGDFNNDGNPDIVALDQYSGCGTSSGDCILVFLGNGDGTFQTPPLVTSADTSLDEFVIGDFKNDGKLDLAVTVTSLETTGLQIFLGNGDGTFQMGAFYPYWGRLAVARLTKSRNLDLVVSANALDVFLGNGDGTFQPPAIYPPDANWLAVADFNGDGIPDIAATEENTGSQALLYLGNGDGTFQPAIAFGTAREPGFIAAGDFNGDHRPDILFSAGKAGATFESVMLNTGVAYFSPDTPLSFGKQTVGTTSAAQTVTLTNTGKSALRISSMKASSQFGVTSTCGSSVAAGAKCSISVTFSPTSTGAKSGMVTINDSASSKPQVIELSGTGD